MMLWNTRGERSITRRLFGQGAADMTSGAIGKQLIEFSIPMAIGLLFQQLYNTVDTIVVGRFVGKAALAAVGSTSSIINMLVGLCAGLAAGSSVVISQCYGAHDERKLSDAVHTTMLCTFILSALATAAGLLIVEPMLRLMSTPEDVFASASQYLSIYFAGISGLLVYNMSAGVLRAVGDSRRPLYFLCFSALTNIALDLLFVLVFHWGIAGVAYATIVSQYLSAGLALLSLTRANAAYAIRWRRLRIRRDVLLQILRIGVPSGVQQAITAFSNVFVQSYINFFGSDCMAGWSCYNKLDIFILIPMQSIGLASTTFVGQNYGARQLRRAREGVRRALLMSVSVTAALAVLLIVCDRGLLRMFNSEEEVLRFGERFVTLCSPFYVLMCFNQIYAGALRGIGRARPPMIIMLSSFVLFRQAYLLAASRLGGGFLAIALAYPIGWVLCSLLMTIAYRRSELCRPEKNAAPAGEPA
ncbi:MAG: MATE family efflux transporter [Clostridia bacterium]|nr:MATE family efflux transporter [Clostridia bacterium]